MGYEAYYYIKGNEEWIMWDDKEYNYMILLIKKGNYKAELLKWQIVCTRNKKIKIFCQISSFCIVIISITIYKEDFL